MWQSHKILLCDFKVLLWPNENIKNIKYLTHMLFMILLESSRIGKEIHPGRKWSTLWLVDTKGKFSRPFKAIGWIIVPSNEAEDKYLKLLSFKILVQGANIHLYLTLQVHEILVHPYLDDHGLRGNANYGYDCLGAIMVPSCENNRGNSI